MKSIIAFLIQEFRALARDEKGLTMVEYAIAGGVIAAAAVTAFSTLGGDGATKFGTLSTAITGG